MVQPSAIAVNGTRLYVEEAGAGPAVVFLRGFTLDTRMWDDQFLPLAQHFRVIRYDLRGFGRPQARAMIVPNAGHMANMEAPEEVTEVLVEFLLQARQIHIRFVE
jgi:pimeloyl-ACP methyl ester carboxylesterase